MSFPRNRWNDPDHAEVKNKLLLRMLEWMVTSNYYNAGYKRNRQRNYKMRCPTETNQKLHGRNSTSSKEIGYL
jgi:hypothetical protein